MSELTGKMLGKYRVREKIGAGGMGAVYKAMDIELDRTVAVKALQSSYGRNPQYLERFRREAQAAAQLDGPHIIDVFDYGEQDGYTYLVMSYISGESLGDRLGQPMDTKTTLDIISQVGEGLAFAHSRGVIHRDIKPSNILLTEDGQAIIVDFGLAKIREAVRITQTGAPLGTAQYMSPEQIRGAKDIDHRTDLYSLGVVLYEMLTGQAPFQADSFWALVKKHVKDPVASPRSLNSEIPLAVEAVVLKALEKAPGARYQTVEDFVAALCEATDQPLPDWIEEARVKRPSEITTVLRREVARRAGRLGLAALIAIVVGLLSAGGFFAYREYRKQQAEVHYLRGVTHFTRESWDLAIYEFDQTLAIDPTYEDAAEKKAEAQKQLDMEKLLGKAKDLFDRADWLTCIEKLEEVRDLDSDYDQVEKILFDAYHNYGQALVEDNQLTRAVEQFDKALELNPEATEVRAESELVAAYQQGTEAYNNDEWENAIDALAEVYSTDTDFKDTQDLLYTAYVKYGQELVEAGNMEKGNACCNEALEIEPGGSEALACLRGIEDQQYLARVAEGNELLDDGRLDEAQAEFERALDIQRGGAEAQAGLDKVYEAHVAKGNELLDDCKCEAAKAEFDKALDIKSDGIEAQDGLDKHVDVCENPELTLIANAKNDYSRTQGYKNWYYYCWVDDGWEEMPWDIGDNHWQCGYDANIGRTPPWMSDQIRFYEDTGHPGPHQEAARVWQSPISGQIKITGKASKEDTRGGDGVAVRIVHNSRELWATVITPYDSKGEAFELYTTVRKDDKIYFVIGSGGGGNATYDLTYFNPSIYSITYKCTPTE